jgi:hypothetical protein
MEKSRLHGHSKSAAILKKRLQLETDIDEAQKHLNKTRLQWRHRVQWDTQNAYMPGGVQNERGHDEIKWGKNVPFGTDKDDRQAGAIPAMVAPLENRLW